MLKLPYGNDMVFEFKYLSLGDLGLTREQVRYQSREDLIVWCGRYLSKAWIHRIYYNLNA